MSDKIGDIMIGIMIGIIIGYYITIIGVAIKISKKLTCEETEKTIVYTYQWEELKDEYK